MAAGKTAYLEKLFLNRSLRRLTTAVSGANASTSSILVTASAGYALGDLVKMTTAGTYHTVTALPDATHITISPAMGAAPTTGNVEAWGFCPPAVYIALFTVAPTDAYTAASPTGTEVSGGNYSRVQVTQADASWAAPSGAPSSTNNSGAITFLVPSANWGSVVAVGVFDSSATGNLLWWNTLNNAKTVNNGDPAPTFPIASLTFTED